MDICDFIKELESEFGPCHRKISYEIVDGKKKMYKGYMDKNDMTQEQMKTNRGRWKPGSDVNAFAIHNRLMKDIYTIDIDDKEKGGKSKLKAILDTMKCYHTETTKGWHYYARIPEFPWVNANTTKMNQLDVGGEGFELDFLKCNCSWETSDRLVNGDKIAELIWSAIQQYFDMDKMNIRNKGEIIEEPVLDEFGHIETDEEMIQCPAEQFQLYIDRLLPHRYAYKSWMDVGFACYNNFDDKNIGFKIWLEWSGKDESHSPDMMDMMSKWTGFQTDISTPITYRSIKMWANEDNPMNEYQEIYDLRGEDALVELMNQEVGYCVMTSEFLHQPKDIWFPKKKAEMEIYFASHQIKQKVKEGFKMVNPFKIWMNHFNRKQYDRVIFDPRCLEKNKDCFNVWTGYKLTLEDVKDRDYNDCQLILNHIKTIWCLGDEEQYDYVLNWFASKLQFPGVKLESVLVCFGKEGCGKNCIVNMFNEIQGDKYFKTIASAQHILGDFNGLTEGKLLIDMNEVGFGGNQIQNNMFKSLITEDKTIINKKNKEAYEIDNLCDYIITTNTAWMISAEVDSRRFNCLQFSNEMVFAPEAEKVDYFTKLHVETKNPKGYEAFAKFLYERDLSDFNPRVFKRTALFNKQVQRSWATSVTWLHMVLDSGSTTIKPVIEWNQDITAQDSEMNPNFERLGMDFQGHWHYHKTLLYQQYVTTKMGTYGTHLSMSQFYDDINEIFGSEMKYVDVFGKHMVRFPNLDEARECFRKNQRCPDYFTCDETHA